jgi:hypothetical protein
VELNHLQKDLVTKEKSPPHKKYCHSTANY